jgi:hypothetical protein
MPNPRIALISIGRSLRASARLSNVAVTSRACGSSPRMTLPVANQNMTCRYSGASPRRAQRRGFTGCFDLTEGLGHAGKSELTQEIEGGMGEQGVVSYW